MAIEHIERPELDWEPYLQRYRKGEWRAPIFSDMILADIERLGSPESLTVLDIGCGKGFDDDTRLQAKIAAASGRYVGVEPDQGIAQSPIFQTVYQCLFENAPIDRSTIDVAFAVMVLEHLEYPATFCERLFEVLREGGVFWGFTIDSRHWFARASSLTEKLGIKEWYLNRLHGRKGHERYENYPVYYRCNTPEQVQRSSAGFRSRAFLNFQRIGQLDYYFPRSLRWLGRQVDRYTVRRGLPGNVMAVRLEK